jgi:hypothetical protein
VVLSTKIYRDGIPIATLPKDGYYTNVSVPPGRHVLSSGKNSSVETNFDSGATYYVELWVSRTTWSVRANLEFEPEDYARKAMASLTSCAQNKSKHSKCGPEDATNQE